MAKHKAIRVTVVVSPVARQVIELTLLLDEGASVAQALLASGLSSRFPELVTEVAHVGVWGRKTDPRQILRDQDRVEIYRSLKVDPMVARRARFVKQGMRLPGLFARKLPGA